jgi:hypothetical protein
VYRIRKLDGRPRLSKTAAGPIIIIIIIKVKPSPSQAVESYRVVRC